MIKQTSFEKLEQGIRRRYFLKHLINVTIIGLASYLSSGYTQNRIEEISNGNVAGLEAKIVQSGKLRNSMYESQTEFTRARNSVYIDNDRSKIDRAGADMNKARENYEESKLEYARLINDPEVRKYNSVLLNNVLRHGLIVVLGVANAFRLICNKKNEKERLDQAYFLGYNTGIDQQKDFQRRHQNDNK
jgi:hypothetical protein